MCVCLGMYKTERERALDGQMEAVSVYKHM